MYRNNCMSAYSPNNVARCGLIMYMTAAISFSKTTTKASLIAEERPGLGMPGRQERISDLVPTAVKTSSLASFSLSIRNCSCFTISHPHNKGWHCTRNKPADLAALPPTNKKLTLGWCFTCAMLHSRSCKGLQLRTVDSDVVLLAVNFFKDIGIKELWMGFRSWKTSKDIPVHHISQLLSPEHCHFLFRAFTGCDIVSALFRLEKTNSIECTACILGDDGHSHRHYKKNNPASAWTHITRGISSVGLYWSTLRTVTHSQ